MRTVTDDLPARTPAPTALRRPRTLPWWPDAVGLFTGGTALVVVALWVDGGGVGALGGTPAEAVTSVGRLSGLLASDLLLLQVLGMARIPVAERSFGQDRLARWHRWTGTTSFYLLLVHLVAVSVGYALADRRSVLGELWSMVLTFPGMLLAAVGTLLVWGVAATSIRAARRRLRYESWHLLHLYAYLGVGLAVPHQLWTGTDLAAHAWARVYWWTLYAAALSAVLIFRVGQPLWLSLRHGLGVVAVVDESPGVVSVHLTGSRLKELRVAPGQYFVFRFLTGPGWTRGHPFSLSAAPSTAGLRLTFDVRGDDGPRLAALAPGTRVLLEGPYGRLTSQVRSRRRVAVFAAGLGIAPLMALLHETAGVGGPATLAYRLSTVQDEALRGDIAWLTEHTGLRYIPLLGRRARSGTPWLPEQLSHVPGPQAARLIVPDLDDHDVYVCGPGPWSDAVVADLHAAGLPSAAIHVENFSW